MNRKFFNIFLSIPVYGILYIITAFSVVITLVFAYLNCEYLVRKVMNLWANTVFIFMGKRLLVSGIDYIEKGKRYILLVNHTSLFDIPAVLAFYPEVSWFGREYLVHIPLFGRLLKVTDFVSMKQAGIKNTKRMLNNLALNSGKHTIAMFPEGTRTITGRMNRLYKGFIYLMRTVQLDVLPVTLNGFFQLKPKTHFYIDFSAKLQVTIHEPFPVKYLIDKDDSEILAIVKSKMESGLINFSSQ